MATNGIYTETESSRLVQQLKDPMTHEWMHDAVTVTRCGHVVSQRTAELCRRQNLPCPIGPAHPAGPYQPNLSARSIVQIVTLPLYLGDAGSPNPFHPVEKKTLGCAIGTIYSYSEGRQISHWIGKVGEATGLLRDDPNSIRTRTRKDLNLNAIQEKVACDSYTLLGKDFYETPRTCLSKQPVLDEFTLDHFIAQEFARSEISETLRIMSRFVETYQDFTHAFTLHQGERVDLIEFLRREHRPPEEIYTPEGKLVPLTGLIELLAVGRILGDTDVLGGGGGNAGFVWVRNNSNAIIHARAVKIDPGYAFQIIYKEGEITVNHVYNILKKRGTSPHFQDLRNIQVANNETSITVIWDKLTTNQKQQFTHVVQSSLKTLATREDILFLFYREGAFQRAEDEQIPLAIAELYTTQMEEWLVHQKNIYLGNGTIEWSFDFQLPLNLKKEKGIWEH